MVTGWRAPPARPAFLAVGQSVIYEGPLLFNQDGSVALGGANASGTDGAAVFRINSGLNLTTVAPTSSVTIAQLSGVTEATGDGVASLSLGPVSVTGDYTRAYTYERSIPAGGTTYYFGYAVAAAFDRPIFVS